MANGEERTWGEQERMRGGTASDHADPSGAITAEARLLNDGRAPYDGGAAQKARDDERRLMMQWLAPGLFLDQEHLNACAVGDHGGPNDPYRQLLLRQAGAAVSRQLMLHPDEYANLLAQARSPRVR